MQDVVVGGCVYVQTQWKGANFAKPFSWQFVGYNWIQPNITENKLRFIGRGIFLHTDMIIVIAAEELYVNV